MPNCKQLIQLCRPKTKCGLIGPPLKKVTFENFVKNRNFCQKSIFWLKIKIFVNKFFLKIEILTKKQIFVKNRNFDQKTNFCCVV